MVYLEIGLVFLLTLVNGVLAMSELAVVSSRPSRLDMLARAGSRGAATARRLAEEPGSFLSTVQIGITLVGILAGAFSGATLGDRLAGSLAGWGVPEFWADLAGVGVVVTAVTYLSLIVGELVPKRLALRNPEKVAAAVAPWMAMLSKIAWPLVWLLDRSGRAVLIVLGQGEDANRAVTEEEIRAMVFEAEHAGVLEAGEGQMISRVMRLGARPVRSVMTPRFEVDMLDLSQDVDAVLASVRASAHSRFPAHEGDADEIAGIVGVRELFAANPQNAAELKALVRQAPIIPAQVDALDVIEALRQSAVHMGLVHDEFGHFIGIVTASDVLEAIVGEFADEQGMMEESVVRRPDGSALVAGWISAEDLADQLAMVLPEKRSYETAAGMLIEAFGRLPAVGETVVVGDWEFEVVDLDGRRIDKILARPHKPDPA